MIETPPSTDSAELKENSSAPSPSPASPSGEKKTAWTPELQKRVFTGILGGSGIILLLAFGNFFGLGAFLVTGVISLGMLLEITSWLYTLNDKIEKRYATLNVGFITFVVGGLALRQEFELLMFCFFVLFAYYLLTARRYTLPELQTHFKELMYSVFALLYVIFLPMYLPLIYQSSNGVKASILFFLIIWSADSGAYFTGRKFGKRKLYPHISPGKTLEGAVGGLIAALLVTLIYKFSVYRELKWGTVMMAPLLVGVFSQFGDLAESFLKRAYDKKDSGTLLPGHGGFLDRFDSVLFGLPVMYACLRVFGS